MGGAVAEGAGRLNIRAIAFRAGGDLAPPAAPAPLGEETVALLDARRPRAD
jgi:hypothetical protein